MSALLWTHSASTHDTVWSWIWAMEASTSGGWFGPLPTSGVSSIMMSVQVAAKSFAVKFWMFCPLLYNSTACACVRELRKS